MALSTLRKPTLISFESSFLTCRSTDGSETLDQFTTAAKTAPASNNIPSNVQGGTFGSSAAVSSSTTASTSSTSTAKPNAASKTLNQETVLVTMGLVMLSLGFSVL